MKYHYEFEVIELEPENTQARYLSIKLPPKIQLVEIFLRTDVGYSSEYYLGKIDKVLKGIKEHEQLVGDACRLEVSKDKTQVFNNLASDGIGNSCEIETVELKKLIKAWEVGRNMIDTSSRKQLNKEIGK